MGLCFFCLAICPGAGLCSASQDPSFMTLCRQRLLWKLPPTLLPIKVDRIASRAERQRGREAEINTETSNCLPPPCRSPQGFCACCLWSLPSPPRFWLTQVSPLLPLRDASHFSIQMTGLFRDSLLTLPFKDGTRNPYQSRSQDWHWSTFPTTPSLSLSPQKDHWGSCQVHPQTAPPRVWVHGTVSIWVVVTRKYFEGKSFWRFLR